MNFEVAYEVECEVNYRYVRIIVELVSVYINILQVIWLLTASKYLKENKCQEKRKIREHYKEHLANFKKLDCKTGK